MAGPGSTEQRTVAAVFSIGRNPFWILLESAGVTEYLFPVLFRGAKGARTRRNDNQ